MSWRVVLATVVLVFGLGMLLGWLGYQELGRQRQQLKRMRDQVESSLAPGEVVVVDDPLLAWALERGKDGALRQNVWGVPETEPVDRLLTRLRQQKYTEIVVVATPGDQLIQNLDAAGFTVAQEVGWVPWDLNGKGRALLWRGNRRIFFASVPKSADKGTAVSSKAK